MGAAAQRDVLVHACHMGDEPAGAAAGACHMALREDGRARWLASVVRFRPAVGCNRSEWDVPARFSSGSGFVDVAPALEGPEEVSRGRRFGIGRLLRGNRALADSQLSDI